MLKDWLKSEKCSVIKYLGIVAIGLSLTLVSVNANSLELKQGALGVACGNRDEIYKELIADKFSPFFLGQETEIIYNEVWVNKKDKTAIHLKTSVDANVSCVTGTSQNTTVLVLKEGVDI